MSKLLRLSCPGLDRVLSVKVHDNNVITEKWRSLYEKIKASPNHFSIYTYKKKILSFFIEDFDSLLLEIDESDEYEIITSLYDSLIKMAPATAIFSLDSMLFVLNFNTSKDIEKEIEPLSLQELYGDIIPDITDSEDLYDNGTLLVDQLIPAAKKKIEKLRKTLLKKIIGQEQAVNQVVKSVKLQVTNIKPFTSLLFVGPTGVGKSELSKILGKEYYGRFFKIDCGSFTEKHEIASLKGAPPGYVGSQDDSILCEKAKESNEWVILFDEIEKASDKFYDFLLNLLDEGKVMDSKGRVLDFSKSIFILTSNQGLSDLKKGKQIGFSKEAPTYTQQIDKVQESIERHFKPEFLNRVDNIIYFNPLDKQSIKEIIKIQLKDYPVNQTDELLNWILANGYSDEYGARNIKRFISSNLGEIVADALLDKQVPASGTMYNILFDNGLPYIGETKDYIPPKEMDTAILPPDYEGMKVEVEKLKKKSKKKLES